jgi:acyl-CoA synthetase (AMP-forming)/AMP-acid ligase II
MSRDTTTITEIPRHNNPYPTDGISRGSDGIAHYDGLPSSLLEMLHNHVTSTPDVEAVVEIGGARLTYQALWDASARVAGGLLNEGLSRGDRVAVRYRAGVAWTLAFWGTLMAGGVPVAVNIRSAQPEIDFVLTDAGTTVDLAADTLLPDGNPPTSIDFAGPDDIAAMFYTSGTTGTPKGVPTTHRAFLSNAATMIRCLGIPRDLGVHLRTLISVPLFHVTGCNSQLLTAAYVGGTSVILPALDLPTTIASLPQERISFMVTVPAVYALLLRHPQFADVDLSSVRWVGYGGSAIAPTLVTALKEAFSRATVFNGYGMTETASLLTALPDADAVEHADSVGYAVPVVDLAIDPIGNNPHLGELLARGPNVMARYWNRPDATADAFTHGWLRTGDVVLLDQAGRISIVDRIKDIIIRGGENVSSLEVENALAAGPGVAEAAVLGLPDDVMGEKVGAVVVGTDDGDVDVVALVKHCQDHLADFKVPQYVAVVPGPLPRNAGGKILKAQLRQEVQWGRPLR